MMPAAWWRPLSDEKVACELCPMGCTLAPGTTGPCGTRMNDEGQMRPLHYGELVSAGLDPIEKKPLYHFHPGRKILSVAAPGCNLHCRFCQNHTISQNTGLVTTSAAPKEVVQEALEAGSVGLAFTYSEPLVWFEFVRDTARLARAAGLKNVLVTNGFLNSEPLAELLPFIDAANVDLKAMDEDFYRRICGGSLQPVLRSIESFHAAGVHLELTNLLIPGHNDTDEHGDRLIAARHPGAGLQPGQRPATLGLSGQQPLGIRAGYLVPRLRGTGCPAQRFPGRGEVEKRWPLPPLRPSFAHRLRGLAYAGEPQFSSTWEAVTQVVIPPRTNHSPLTSIMRGCTASTRSSRILLVTFSWKAPSLRFGLSKTSSSLLGCVAILFLLEIFGKISGNPLEIHEPRAKDIQGVFRIDQRGVTSPAGTT
ncbi:AmmeMemoRadiSam system radical SAM enzyme [bacterium DOLJORAL78_65_58]|nr:MAG: AmmeMemoRadiSam system radical SAM enzyme [bacterium DOLJORAL78_65_58]